MRLLYGVHGYGRGHAGRTLALLPHLMKQHHLTILAGGDAYETIAQHYPVIRIPTLGFVYQRGQSRRSNLGTMRKNLAGILDARLRGPVFELVQHHVEATQPDVILSDAELWTHRVAQHLRIPRISIDHFGILAYCYTRLRGLDWCKSFFDANMYRFMMGQPERVIVSSFYPVEPKRPGVTIVGAFCRPELQHLQPRRGEHLLVYLNRGEHQFTPRLEQTLLSCGRPIYLYGTQRRGTQQSITFKDASNLPFLEDLAQAHAVLCTAGNQLVGEAIALGKPLLVMPEDCVEQRLNADGVERLGIGMQIDADRISPRVLQRFLEQVPVFAENTRLHRHDGVQETLQTLERYLRELSPRPFLPSPPVLARVA
jgi:uncharacterized protein (TIGR00661 family)